MAVQLSPESKVQFMKYALHNALLEPKSKMKDFLKTIFVSKSFLKYSQRFFVYSFTVMSLSAERSMILIGKYGKIYEKYLDFEPASHNEPFSHQLAIKLIKTLKPPVVTLALSQDLVTTQELQQYAEALRKIDCEINLIFDEKPEQAFFLPLVQPIAKQVVFIDCETQFLAENVLSNQLNLDFCVCYGASNIGQIQQLLKHNIKKLHLNFNWGQFTDAISIGGGINSNGEDGDSNICESLELLILKYQADPDELIEIMAEIRELCPNLKCIVVQADFEDKDSIRDFNNKFFGDVRKYLGFVSKVIEFYEKNLNLCIYIQTNVIFHLTFDSLANPHEAFAQLESFNNYKAVEEDKHTVHEVTLFGEKFINLTLKVVQYKPKATFFAHVRDQVRGFIRGMYNTLLQR